MEIEHKVTDRYFKTIIKWMPLRLKRRIIERIEFIASLPIDIYDDLPKLLHGISTEEKKEFLESLLAFMKKNLSEVEKVYLEIQEDGS
jgi:CO dehydrogenase/acetyl-CoA synthase beta subunit